MSFTQQPVSEATEIGSPQELVIELLSTEQSKLEQETLAETKQEQEKVEEAKAEEKVVEELEDKPEVEKVNETPTPAADETPAPEEPEATVVPPTTAPIPAPEPAKQEGEQVPTAPVTAPVVVEEKPTPAQEAKTQKTGSGKKPHPVITAIGSIFKRKSTAEVIDISNVQDQVEEIKEETEKVAEVDPLDLLKKPDVLEDTLTKVTSSEGFKEKVKELKLEECGKSIGEGFANSAFGPSKGGSKSSFQSALVEEEIKQTIYNYVQQEPLQLVVVPFIQSLVGPIEERIEENLQVGFWKALSKGCCS